MNDFVIDEIKCAECPLFETSFTHNIRRSGVYGRGSGRNGLWFYGESLGADEINMGLPFVGRKFDILQLILKDVGIDDNECFFTTSVRCLLPHNKNPKAIEVKKCMDTHALKDVPQIPPKLIITLGKVPLKSILNLQKITENRGKFFDSELFNCKVLPMYDPSILIHNSKYYNTLRDDLIKARDFILEQQVDPIKHHKQLINSKFSFLQCTELLSSDNINEIYCDLETTGLEFFKEEIASISFTIKVDNEYFSFAFLAMKPFHKNSQDWWYADLNDLDIREALQKVLKKRIIFHGGLFDIKFFWKNNLFVNCVDDTMAQHHLIDENSPHNLKYLTGVYNKGSLESKEEFYGHDEYEEGTFYQSPPELLLNINIDDTFNGLLLKNKFDVLLEKENLTKFYKKITVPSSRSFSRMSYRGIMMDRDGIKNTSEKYRNRIRENEDKLFNIVGNKFDYSKTKDLLAVLYNKLKLPIIKRTAKSNQPSTDVETLDNLALIHPVPSIIKELRHLKGTIVKYLDGNDLSEELDPALGLLCCLDNNDRIHGPFLMTGTISGRPSCPKPNLLNIPKNPEIRQLFIAPQGWKLIEFDYSQAELVLMAHLSTDPEFIKAINTTDFHLATAKGILKMLEVDEFGRRNAKSANFLKIYGGGAEKLSKSIQASENKLFLEKFNITQKIELKCTNKESWYHTKKVPLVPFNYFTVNKDRDICYVCEADNWLKGWDRLYAEVPRYRNEISSQWKENGFIEGIYGRKRRFSPAFTKQVESKSDRQAVNFMCQNGVGDAINSAIIDIDYLFDMLFGWSPETVYGIPGMVLSVYDSILVEAPDEIVGDIKNSVLEIMSAPLPKLNISLKTDVNISQKWGEKLKKEEIENEVDYVL